MLQQEETVQTLVNLGLTVLQAKVYVALAKLGASTGRTTAKEAKVASQDVYRVLIELQEKGLVEKIIARPNKYRPIPLQDGFSVLLKHKAYEYKEIEKKTAEILDRFRTNHQENTTAKECEFAMITTKDACLRRLNKAAAITTKKSVDVIDSWDSFKYSIVVYAEQIIKGAKKNVRFRFITDKPKDGETVPKIFQTWKKNGYVQLRHIPTQPPTSIRIEDREQVTICIMTTGHAVEAPSLFSDHPCLVAILQDYFERVWSEATEANI